MSRRDVIRFLIELRFGEIPYTVAIPCIGRTHSLQWRRNERNVVWSHRRLDCFFSTVCSGAGQRKRQSSASLAFVRGSHQSPVNSPHKGPVTGKMLPVDDVIMPRDDDITIQCYHYPCHPQKTLTARIHTDQYLTLYYYFNNDAKICITYNI